MKVIINNYGNPFTCELSEALVPDESAEGIAEKALELARSNANAIGRLCELLVERGELNLLQACNICGVYYNSIREAKE